MKINLLNLLLLVLGVGLGIAFVLSQTELVATRAKLEVAAAKAGLIEATDPDRLYVRQLTSGDTSTRRYRIVVPPGHDLCLVVGACFSDDPLDVAHVIVDELPEGESVATVGINDFNGGTRISRHIQPEIGSLAPFGFSDWQFPLIELDKQQWLIGGATDPNEGAKHGPLQEFSPADVNLLWVSLAPGDPGPYGAIWIGPKPKQASFDPRLQKRIKRF